MKLIPKLLTAWAPLEKSDNTRVLKPKELLPIKYKLKSDERFEKDRNGNNHILKSGEYLISDSKGNGHIVKSKQALFNADNRTKERKAEDAKTGEAKHWKQEDTKARKNTEKAVAATVGLGALAAAQVTPAAPYIDAAFAAHGLSGLGEQANNGTLGMNWETAGNIAETLPLGIKLAPKIIKRVNEVANSKPTLTLGKQISPSQTLLYSNKQQILHPWEIYTLRAKSKGITLKQLDAIGHFDLSTESGIQKAAEHIARIDSDPNFTFEELINEYKGELLRLSKEGDGFGPGMGWNDLLMTHVLKSAFPDTRDFEYVKLHETEHTLHNPSESINEALDLLGLKHAGALDYYTSSNNTEVGARISLVLTNAGIADNRTFTGSLLKHWFEQYLTSGNLNNDMRTLYHRVKDWDLLAKWASDPKNVLTTAGAAYLGGSTMSKKHGGKLTYFI